VVGVVIALAAALVTVVAIEPIAVAAWHGALQAQEPAPVPTASPVPEVAPGEWQVGPSEPGPRHPPRPGERFPAATGAKVLMRHPLPFVTARAGCPCPAQ